ncbi:MAG: hypothetical protein FJZ59_01525 [Chlamydiae bacterium]|jgi:hypothetical protein|nr:hypothetical protein [Chlamydiota bacterium]
MLKGGELNRSNTFCYKAESIPKIGPNTTGVVFLIPYWIAREVLKLTPKSVFLQKIAKLVLSLSRKGLNQLNKYLMKLQLLKTLQMQKQLNI